MRNADFKMHPHEEATIQAFIIRARRTRWRESLTSAKKRGRFLDRLNHCADLDLQYARPLPSNADVAALLRSQGAPATCYVISDVASIDGQELPLDEAVAEAEFGGWGTIISCVPGRLACYIDEAGTERRLLLVRTAERRRT